MSSLTSVGESLVMSRHVVAIEWNVRSGMSKLLSVIVDKLIICSFRILLALREVCNDVRSFNCFL